MRGINVQPPGAIKARKAQLAVDAFNKRKSVNFTIEISARNVLPYVTATGTLDSGGPETAITITEKKRGKRLQMVAPFPADMKALIKRISTELSIFMQKL